KAALLQEQIAHIRTETEKLGEGERSTIQQIGEVDAKLAQPSTLTLENQQQLEEIRTALSGPQLEQTRALQASLEKEDAALVARLRTVNQRLQELQATREAINSSTQNHK